MKKSFIAGLIAISFGISAQAYAKDLNAIDVPVGDFAGILTIDLDKLIANDLIGGSIEKNQAALDKNLDILKQAGLDYKKDIDMITIAVTDKGSGCFVLDANKSLVEPVAKLAADPKAAERLKIVDYKGRSLYQDDSSTLVLVSDKRALACMNSIDIKPSIDNFIVSNPKTLKDRNSTLNSMYKQTSSSAEIRIAGRMTSSMRKKVATYKVEGDNGEVLKVEDIDSGSVSISFSNGLNVNAIAKMKSDAIASTGSSVLTTTVGTFLEDQTLKDIGLDFLAKSVTFSSDKKNLKGQLKLTKEQLALIIVMTSEMSNAAN